MTTLLICLFFCHFLADFTPLSTPWMLRAKLHGTPLFPILAHASVHATLMGIVLLTFGCQNALELICFQLLSHFLIDVAKGRASAQFPSLKSNATPGYWAVMGIDQFFHATVILLMVHFSRFSI